MVREENKIPDNVSPDAILQIGTGFRAAKLLFVASELGLFEHLAAGPTTLSGLADATEIDLPRLGVLVNALVALGLLEHRDGAYRNGPVAAAYLSGQTALDLRPALRFWNRLSYPFWMGLEDALRAGQPQGRFRTERSSGSFPKG